MQVVPEALDALAEAHDLDLLDLALLRALIDAADWQTGQVLGASLLDLAGLVRLRASEGHARRVVRRSLCRLAGAGLVIEAPAVRVTRAGTTRRTGLLNLDLLCWADVVRGGRREAPQAEAPEGSDDLDAEVLAQIEAEIEPEIEVPDPRTGARHPRTHARGARTDARSTCDNAPLDRKIAIPPPSSSDADDRVLDLVGRIGSMIGSRLDAEPGLLSAIAEALDAGWNADDLASRVSERSLTGARNLGRVIASRVRALGAPAPEPVRQAPPFVRYCPSCGKSQWDCFCEPAPEAPGIEQGTEAPEGDR